MALASGTGGAARSTVLKVTQVEPSQGFVAWEALVDETTMRPRPGDSVAAHTCDAQQVQGCEGAEGKAHSVVIESC